MAQVESLSQRSLMALVLLRAGGWILFALSILLFFIAGKAGPQAALTMFFAVLGTQVAVAIVAAITRIVRPTPFSCQLWRFASPYAMGAIIWGAGFAVLRIFTRLNQ